jgi:hypothetical protein
MVSPTTPFVQCRNSRFAQQRFIGPVFLFAFSNKRTATAVTAAVFSAANPVTVLLGADATGNIV